MVAGSAPATIVDVSISPHIPLIGLQHAAVPQCLPLLLPRMGRAAGSKLTKWC